MDTSTVPTVPEATLPEKWIDADSSVFRENFEQKSFEVFHAYAGQFPGRMA